MGDDDKSPAILSPPESATWERPFVFSCNFPSFYGPSTFIASIFNLQFLATGVRNAASYPAIVFLHVYVLLLLLCLNSEYGIA